MPRELRVFISSTFHDLQAERDYLLKHVFPRIRQMCRERGVEFTEIDLRWGLTAEEAARGRVIRPCLEEIDYCRPYFIGILGSRYGWAPQILEVQKDGELVRTYPWVEDGVLEGQSLLELEFTHGLLHAPVSPDAIVLHRRESGSDSDPDATARVLALRDRVIAHGYPVHTFESPQELGEIILHHLVAIIERTFPRDAQRTELQYVQQGHEAFAASRRRAYIADLAAIARLNAHANGTGPALVVTSPSGYGKSALLAFWVDAFRRKNPHAFVVTHFVGVGAQGADRAGVIRHCMLEIKERLGIPDPIPDNVSALEEEFPVWLARTRDIGMVLVIDAIDQLGREASAAWLPQFLPPTVRLIVSTVPGAIVDELVERGWARMDVAPMQEPQREALVVRFLGEYHKGLSHAQIRRIVHTPNAAVPLFLRTMLEELRLSGSFELLDARIDHYCAAHDLEDLFQRVLERMEQDHGADIVRRVLSAIWGARRGLREEEIAAAAGIPRDTVRVLMQGFEYHMVWRDGLRTFFHAYLRDAVEARYLSGRDAQRSTHAQLAAYFSRLPLDARRADEEPWQWQQAEAWEQLHDCLTSIPMFLALYAPGAEYAIREYWLAMGDRYNMVQEYMRAAANYKAGHAGRAQLAPLYHALAILTRESSLLDEAEPLFRTACDLFEQEYGAKDWRTASCLDDLGGLFYFQGKYNEAERVWRQVLAVREEILAPDDMTLCESLDNLSALLYARANFVEMEQLCRRSIAIREAAFGHDTFIAAGPLNNLAASLAPQGKLDESLAAMERYVTLQRAALGDRHPEVGRSLINLGVICEQLSRPADAERHLLAAVDILRASLGSRHEYTIRATGNLGSLLHHQRRFDEARQRLQESIALSLDAFGPQHVQTLTMRCKLAALHAEEGRAEMACEEFAGALPQLCALLDPGLPEVGRFTAAYAAALRASGHHDEALAWDHAGRS